LRAGVKLIPYLNEGHYYGIDISAALLDGGRREIAAAGLRLPAGNLRVSGDFDLAGFPSFDFGIAQSVFTHLPPEALRACLTTIRPNFVPAGRLFATFFIAPDRQSSYRHQRGGIVSHADADPFHTSVEAVAAAAVATGWRALWIGEWEHPRDQQMCEFVPALSAV
jgi:hypothetical protein